MKIREKSVVVSGHKRRRKKRVVKTLTCYINVIEKNTIIWHQIIAFSFSQRVLNDIQRTKLSCGLFLFWLPPRPSSLPPLLSANLYGEGAL